MSQDFCITEFSLSTQRRELEVSARELDATMSAAHSTETGVQAPVGRTSLRETLEGAIGETRALVQIGQDDVQKIADRLLVLETQTADLDLRLGAGWEELPL